MRSWTIFNKNGIAKASVKELDLRDEWMAECYVTLSIASPTPIDFAIGDYIDYRGERYTIQYDPNVLKKATSGSYGEGFTYSNIKFVGLQDEIVRCDFNDIVLKDNQVHYTALPTFPFYCETVDDLLDRIQANLEELYPKQWIIIGLNTYRNNQRASAVGRTKDFTNAYKKYIDKTGAVNTEPYGNIGVAESVDNITCWDALKKVHDDFGLNFIIRGRVIIVGTAGIFTANTFRYGKGKGLYEIERIAESEQQIVTRLRAYGSEDNLPSHYYSTITDPSSNLPNNMAVSRLMLPGFPNQSLADWVDEHKNLEGFEWLLTAVNEGFKFSTEVYRPYIDSPNISEYGIRPSSIYFDGSNETENIHPTIEGMEYQQAPIDEIYSAESISDNGVYKAGESVNHFTITLPELGFKLNEVYEDGASIDMKNGMCGARSFKITNVPSKDKDGRWVCEVERVHDDSLDMWFPYCDFQIKNGDKYVLTGIKLPDAYISSASVKLLKNAIEALRKNHAPRYTYQPRIDEIWMQEQHDKAMSSNDVVSLHDTLKAGDIFSFADADLNIDANIIIDVLSIKENGEGVPTYEITLRDEKQVGTIQKIANKIDSVISGAVSVNAVGTGGLTSRQVQSLIDRIGSEKFLSKLDDDKAQGYLTLLQGMQVGEKYVPGLLGEGGVFRREKDGTVYFEADKAYFRMKVYFDSVEVREYQHSQGNRVASVAGNKCIRVEWIQVKDNKEVILAQTADNLENVDYFRCYFRASDGEDTVRNNFVVGDQVYCHITSIAGSSDNPEEKGDNQKHYWRLCIGRNTEGSLTKDGEAWVDLSNRTSEKLTISKKNYTHAGYQSGSDVPEAQDSMIQLGNINDTARQGAIIEFVTGPDSPSYQIYQGINDFSLADKNKVALGYDTKTGRAYMNIHGDTYIGDPDGSTFIRYNSETKELDIKAKIQILPSSTIGDKTLEEFVKSSQNEYDDSGINKKISALTKTVDDTADAAKEANDNAKAAQETADSAQGAAEGAQKSADDAADAAKTADGKAVKAQTSADDAKKSAGDAQKSADDAADAAKAADEKAAAAKKAADEAKAKAATFEYLAQALSSTTEIDGGLILSTLIALRDSKGGVWSGINGAFNEKEEDEEGGVKGHGIAAWYGGGMIDHEYTPSVKDYAMSLFRFDGSGYLAGGNISWDKLGKVTIKDIYTDVSGSEKKLGTMLNDLMKFNNVFHFRMDGNNVLGIVPQVSFDSLSVSGKAVATEEWVKSKYVSIEYFNRLFQAYSDVDHAAEHKVMPNDVKTTIDNLKIMVGTWTEKYLSALGLSPTTSNSGSTAVGVLDDLNDVEISGAAKGQVLQFDGAHWTNVDASFGADMVSVWTALSGSFTSDQISIAHLTDLISTLTGYTTSGKNYAVKKDSKNQLYVNVPWTDTKYTLPVAAADALGGIKLGYTTAGKKYAVEVDTDGNAFVNVPWSNTTYTFTNKGATLAWGETATIATVGGVDIKVTMPANPDTNTWRGIQDNLTSDSAVDSLSAKQGKALKASITTLEGYFSNGVANKAKQLNTSRTIWGQSFNGTANVSGNMTGVGNITMSATNGTYIQLGDIRIVYDSAHNALKVVKSDGETAANFYATGGLTALGHSESGESGGGVGDVTWDLLADSNDKRQIDLSHLTTALSGLATEDWVKKNFTNFTLAVATANALGGVKVGYTTSGKNYAVQLDSDNKMYVNVPWANTTYSAATQSAAGLMSAADKKKLDGIAEGANKYTYSLPTATASALGGIKIGFTTSGKKYAIVLDSDGKAYVNVPWTDTNTTYTAATQSAAGLMSAADKKKLDGIAEGANKYTYTLPTATADALGGVKIGYKASGKNYAVALDTNGKMYVNVPWTDTTYTFTNKGATLAWGETATIATIGGVDIKVTMPANPDTNTWRGIQDNLTSDSTVDSLSAKQGKLLKASITTLEGYFSSGVAKKASQLNTSRTLWGQSFNGTANVSGNMTGVGNITMAAANGTYIQLGDIRIVYDSANNALKVVKSDGKTAANFYATGGLSALGKSENGTSGGGGDVTWDLLADSNDKRQVDLSHLTTALSGFATEDWVTKNFTNFTLAAATASTLGGIKIGFTTSGKNYAVALDANGKAYVNVPWTDNNTTYSAATQSAAGLMSAADKKKLDGIASGANNYTYTLPTATASALGGIKIGFTASGKNYAVVLDSNGKAYVNVPWTDNNTTYSAFTASAAGLAPAASSANKTTAETAVGNYYLCADGKYRQLPANAFKNDNTTYTFTNKGATLSWGATSTIATVGGVDIKVTMPANPNTDHYAWSDITGKPSTFAPSSHNHSQIVTEGDNRSVATTPNNYSNALVFKGLKNNSSIGSPYTDAYSYLVGLRGWGDSSGGNSHELAFNGNGIYRRQGATTSWGSWYHLLDSSNSSVSLSGSTLTVKINGVEKSLTNTNTTYSAGYGLTLSGTTFTLGYRWNAVTQGQKWSRIMLGSTKTSTVGCNGILTLRCTRGNVVANATFLVTTSHSCYGQIVPLSSNNYTPIRSRILVDTSGNFYIELYDTAQSIKAGTTQTWYCTFVPLSDMVVTTYTAFTNGSTVPSGYTAQNDFTTSVGNDGLAIKSISRSGTTFTATRVNGSTFTFTQQDNNTTYSANNGVGLSGTTFYNSGVRAATINGNYLRVNTNGTNADLTIPYATSAGSVAWGNVTGKPSVAVQGAHNNLTASGNEFTFASSGFSGGMYINYRTAGGTNGNITEYYAGNGKGGSLGTFIHSGNYSNWCAAKSHTHSYLPLSGGTLTGQLVVVAGHYNYRTDSGNYGINMNNSDLAGVNGIYTSDYAEDWGEGLNFARSSGGWDSFYAQNGSFYFATASGTLKDSARIGSAAANIDTIYTNKVHCGNNNNLWLQSANNVYITPGSTALSASNCIQFGSNYMHIMGGTGNNMAYNTTNPRIIFSENGTQAVGLVYTDYDSYRASKGIKCMDVDNSDTNNVWFEVQGSIIAGGGVTALSDARHKRIIRNTNLSINQIAAMPTIIYKWNDGRKDKNLYAGSIAQNWKSILPEVVSVAGNKEGTLSMDYGVAALVSAVTTARKVVDHERRIEELERENKRLKKEVEQLKLVA